MSGFDDLSQIFNSPQSILDLLDNDLISIKNKDHAENCVRRILTEIKNNLDNVFCLSFASRLKNKELMYQLSDEVINNYYRQAFSIIADSERNMFICRDYDDYIINFNLTNDEDYSHIPKPGDLRLILSELEKQNIEQNRVLVELAKTLKIEYIGNKTKDIHHYYGDILNIKPKEFYLLIRNQFGAPYATLKQDDGIKSQAEKYIADFLFEHGIDYVYEKIYDLECLRDIDSNLDQVLGKYGSGYTKPDFFLPQYKLVWEHWGIDEFDQTHQSHPSISWEEYKRTMELKRALWRNAKIWLVYSDWRYGSQKSVKEILSVDKLIETSISDLKNGRYDFEEIIKKLLTSNGIICQKRDEDELVEEVWDASDIENNRS